MIPTNVERWWSSDTREEVHFFVADGAQGRSDTYILGFNPDRIPVEDVREFLARYGYQGPSEDEQS